MDWCTIIISAFIGFVLGIVATIAGDMMIVSPYIEKLKQPDMRPSFVKDECGDKVNGRILNFPITNRFQRRIVKKRNEIQRLTVNVAIIEEVEINGKPYILQPRVQNNNVAISIDDDPNTKQKVITLPASGTIGATVMIIDSDKANGVVKATNEEGDCVVVLPQGQYKLQMQVTYDGEVKRIYRRFTVNTEVPLVEWEGGQWQE